MSQPSLTMPRGFLRFAGGALAAAGVLTLLINAGLSPFLSSDASFAETAMSPVFFWRQSLSALTALLLVFGSIGLYLAQAESLGQFGAVSFVSACVGSMLILATEWTQVFLVPELATAAPEALNALGDTEGVGRYTLGTLIALAVFTLGWIAFAAASLRAHVFSRPGPILVIAGFFAIPILGGLLPGVWGFAAGNAVLGAGWVSLGQEIARGTRNGDGEHRLEV